MTTNPLELLMQVANGHTVYDGALRRVAINKHTWESIQTWANPRRSFDFEPPNNEINTAISGLPNAYLGVTQDEHGNAVVKPLPAELNPLVEHFVSVVNTSVNTPMSTDMLFGACVALMWATNVCDDERYDLASAMAGVEATVEGDGVPLTELWTRLAGDVVRGWEHSLPLPEWF